jgi:hypothetical protein
MEKPYRFRLTFDCDSKEEIKPLLDKAMAFAKGVGQNPRNAVVEVLRVDGELTDIGKSEIEP